MINDPYFKFRTNVSSDYYIKKEDAKACLSRPGAKAVGKTKMSFTEQTVSVNEFLNLATSGYAFCNLFHYDVSQKYPIEYSDGKITYSYPVYKRGPNKGCMKLSFKSDLFCQGSQTIFVDVDFTRYQTVQEYLDRLYYQPTCTYMSFSDKLFKSGRYSRRFRLVYVFDTVLNPEEFKRISKLISDMVVNCTGEPMDDDCGTRMSQYMNGVYGNNETYTSNIIYSPNDFPKGQTLTTNDDEEIIPVNTSQKIDFNNEMCYYMENMSYNDFMHYYSLQYRYVYRTELPVWNSNYQETQPGFLQLWYRDEKVQDGNHRRSKLFKNACLRKLMYPDIDPDTLLFNLYIDRERFFDNSDGVIDMETLKRKARYAMQMSNEELIGLCSFEIEYWALNRPQYIFKSGVSHGEINTTLKSIRYSEIYQKYDSSISLKENIQRGIGIPRSTLYRFCKEFGIDTNPGKNLTKLEKREQAKLEKIEKISLCITLHDSGLSLRTILNRMVESDMHVSLGTISNWINKYSLDNEYVYESDWLSPEVQCLHWDI